MQDPKEAEAWFVAHGLPYFVDDIRADVRSGLSRARMVSVLLGALAVALPAAIGAGLWSNYASVGIATAATTVLLVFALYAARALKFWMIAKWAVARTFHSLGLLFPLATRALPMLLLFITFLFINTEVWQVASALDCGVLWAAVLLFAAVAVGFLVVRLIEELDRLDDEIGRVELADEADVTGLQKANLVLVLLIAQIVQVLLLSVAVFAFFIVFGAVAIDRSVIESWIAAKPYYPLDNGVVSRELIQVSTFLAGFSGLYFAVYAVTDEVYRKEFFTDVMGELQRALSVRVGYRLLRRPPG